MNLKNNPNCLARDVDNKDINKGDVLICIDATMQGDTGEGFDLKEGSSYTVSSLYHEDILAPMVELSGSTSGPVYPNRFKKVEKSTLDMIRMLCDFLIQHEADDFCQAVNGDHGEPEVQLGEDPELDALIKKFNALSAAEQGSLKGECAIEKIAMKVNPAADLPHIYGIAVQVRATFFSDHFIE